MRFDSEFLQLTNAAEALLLALLGLDEESKIGVVSAVLPGPPHAGLSLLDLNDGIPRVVEGLGTRSFDGILIIPPFGMQISSDTSERPLPPGWNIARYLSEEYLVAHALVALDPGGYLIALVPLGLLVAESRRSAREAILAHGLRLVAKLPNRLLWENEHLVDTYVLVLQKGAKLAEQIVFIDCRDDAIELPSVETFRDWLEMRSGPESGIHPVIIDSDQLRDNVRLDPAYYDPAHLDLRAPEGFSEVKIAEIADLIGGVRVESDLRLMEPSERCRVPYIQVRHMAKDDFDGPLIWLPEEVVATHRSKIARAGDILVSTSGTVGKAVLVDDRHPEGVLYDTSIRRLRLRDPAQANPSEVAEFLRSDLGQLQFQRLSAGSVITYLTNAQFKQIRVFLPNRSGDPGNAPHPSEETAHLGPNAQLEAQLEAILRQIRSGQRDEWRESVAKSLRDMVTILVPTSLSERVRTRYPAPLAIPYRRYMMAQHNPYEQLDRMINLVEACTYFVFHVLLADYGRAPWRDKIELSKQTNSALRSRATFEQRIHFINDFTEAVQTQRFDLFVPGLADCKIGEDMDFFRAKLRNPVAHSAPGSQAYVNRLVREHQDRLDLMLEKLEFLADYTLCRIRNHFFDNGRWHYHCELYKGEEYDTTLKEMQLPEEEQGVRLIAAERNHLVLISPELEPLDLWPYYQLYFGEATCRESHLCVVKHLTLDPRQLHGESVRSGIELALPGFGDYYRGPAAS